MTTRNTGQVLAVHRSGSHEFSKTSAPSIELVAGLGVVGDAHQGTQVQHRSRVAADPTQPNLRQVHLIHGELFDEVAEQGFTVGPGDLGENITTQGIDLVDLPTGAVLAVGTDVLLTVTGLRNPCQQIDRFQPGLLGAVLHHDEEEGRLVRRAGVMAMVIRGGTVTPGSPVRVSRPALPHHQLEPV